MSRTANLELPVSLPAKMPAINTIKIFLHLVQILCTVITVCVVAPIIAAENRFYASIYTESPRAIIINTADFRAEANLGQTGRCLCAWLAWWYRYALLFFLGCTTSTASLGGSESSA